MVQAKNWARNARVVSRKKCNMLEIIGVCEINLITSCHTPPRRATKAFRISSSVLSHVIFCRHTLLCAQNTTHYSFFYYSGSGHRYKLLKAVCDAKMSVSGRNTNSFLPANAGLGFRFRCSKSDGNSVSSARDVAPARIRFPCDLGR